MAEQPQNLTIPLKLDAFVFNRSVCDGNEDDAKIAPITQPNYTFLQLSDTLIQPDILDHVDLHNAIPAESNPRLMDLGQGTVRSNRVGVYLHWILPRFYRTGAAASPSGAPGHTQRRQQKGLRASGAENPANDYSAPEFPALPNRWLVIRTLDPNAPTTAPKGAEIDPVEAWVIESDRLRSIDDEALSNADLQVDISPYITSNKESIGNIHLKKQAEAFIGYKQRANEWSEDHSKARVDLTAVSSSNQLFVDYQPHCSNVFSTVDTFACKINGADSHLTQAVASYYVIGWHSEAADGPFGKMDPSSHLTRRGRMDALSMAMKGEKELPEEIKKWLGSEDPAQILCHGAMYDVEWNASTLPPKVPANDASQTLTDSMSVAVGTTPIDSLLAYIESHKTEGLEQDLRLIAPLLRAQDEGVDAHRAATDEVLNWNFARESGGQYWLFQSPDDKPAVKPSDTEAAYLEQLNRAQRMLDGTSRQVMQLQWQMFSYWWQLASSPEASPPPMPVEPLTNRINTLTGLARTLQTFIDSLSRDTSKFSRLPQSGVLREFSQPRDPTLLVAGISAGWPDDYLDRLEVRLDTQLVGATPSFNASPFCIDRLPEPLQKTAQALVEEFVALRVGEVTPPKYHYVPLYHDHGKHGLATDPLRDQWGKTQPWAPLFLEWQADYFHIPWKDWDLIQEQKGQLDPHWRFGITPGTDLAKEQIKDIRSLSGRILLLPQPSFSLQAAIDQLFNSIDPEVLKKYLPTKEQRDNVLYNTYKLPFLSAPLDGFTDHLLTLSHGTHIKPNARYPGEGVQPIADAYKGPFHNNELKLIGIHSEMTPYASLVRFTAEQALMTTAVSHDDPSPVPFKPVTHGQFRFKKLNIIDKFGQAINAIDPRYGYEDREAVYPHISEYFAPQLLPDGQPNVVRQPVEKGYCEFAQVPPGINQHARLNSAFMIHDTRSDTHPTDYSYWRPVTEWENPIWGWIVLNYVDYGIQVFLPDGTFYREVRIASPTAPQHTSTSAKWLPFNPPATSPDTGQLDQLLNKLADPDPTYLLAFLDMANKSLESSSSVPSAYATFMNSLVGRPLALVNAGWSLELATDAKSNQSTLDPRPPKLGLMGGQDIYQFPVKLGDENRASDGLVGYFKTKSRLKAGDELDLSKIFTYYTGDNPTGPLEEISTTNFPDFQAFWLKPDSYIERGNDAQQGAQEFFRDWNRAFQVFGMIIDPFVPVTAYSSMLPMNNLRLPPWTWQKAFEKMTAFFHMGPTIVSDDVQQYYHPDKALSADYKLYPPSSDQTIEGSAVGIPSLQSGSWAWLQPFINATSDNPEYMALGLGKVDSRPKYQKGPYTAIEGYLQLKAPIIRPEDAASGSAGPG
ncbi:hypothetical protein D8B26_007692 [Coccidioides posadasii str. Silveira]|uniref:Uncharacterized protein n=2 Tax=Coccidioides posadasii TaxID=199306 RepID=A0A0J6FFJ6_COCPO|nr:hypothetical protein CPC735_016930 [Coccidioides posadasii C735 delta SOWgp]EER25092.1 hypothetical protein CPC735_016930 [Coccidioides posadasii C735 delta SOWgp]KMM71926.1 hypothetical protein CPAG_08226 [Coccidioides posadasii RMSCC 3488]QVM13077.1 hypothetical protein D8B26_007692 [Coccidioides posadasii str. Silveira]|eukprot:XP_003067237.1 hypothetical protein CPC735_016930 [Coccidioides posadasii C735 delta SOWgp]